MHKGKPDKAAPTRKISRPRDEVIFGLHAVRAALLNSARRHKRLRVTQNAANLLAEPIAHAALAPEICTSDAIARALPTGVVHQGVLLSCAPLPPIALTDIIPDAPLLVALDRITDPRNIGAILRACAVFGVGGVIMLRKYAPRRDAALAKTACGAVEQIPIVETANLARALTALAKADYAIIGLDERADTPIGAAQAASRRVCVMGAEDKGLRRLTRAHCTQLCHLPSRGDFATLNVATATAVALYALTAPK